MFNIKRVHELERVIKSHVKTENELRAKIADLQIELSLAKNKNDKR